MNNVIYFLKMFDTVGRAINKAFNPTKFNYGAYSYTLSHLHIHIVPKYKEDYAFGSVFEMNLQKNIFQTANMLI